jgi:hypothetical protein
MSAQEEMAAQATLQRGKDRLWKVWCSWLMLECERPDNDKGTVGTAVVNLLGAMVRSVETILGKGHTAIVVRCLVYQLAKQDEEIKKIFDPGTLEKLADQHDELMDQHMTAVKFNVMTLGELVKMQSQLKWTRIALAVVGALLVLCVMMRG